MYKKDWLDVYAEKLWSKKDRKRMLRELGRDDFENVNFRKEASYYIVITLMDVLGLRK